MELNNEFHVGVSVPETWLVLTDVERIAPLLPGAQLQEVEGDEYRGVVKVKVGPITAQYKGAATFVEQDESAGRVVLKASGRDTRGQGNASALITATMESDADGTKVSVHTDLTVTGKVAQFGRGVLADVSAKLIGQFVDALEEDIRSSGTSAPTAPPAPSGSAGLSELSGATPSQTSDDPIPSEVTGPEPDADTAVASDPVLPDGAPAPSGTIRRIDGPEAEPLDLLAVAGESTLRRIVPIAGVLVVLFVVLARRRGHRLAKLASKVIP